MLETLIETVGLWFFMAVALEAAAVFVEQWGAARSPDDDAPKHSALALLALLLTILTPGLLLVHAFMETDGADQTIHAVAMGAPILAVLVGALLGAIAGATARGAAPLMRKLALPLDVVASGAAIFATLTTLQTLIGAALNGGVIVTH